MQSIYKKKCLTELYDSLEKMIEGKIDLRYPIEVKEVNNGLAFKIFSTNEDISLYFYPNHPVSEVNIIRKGMRFIYPKRAIRFKRHTIGDLMNVITKDDRMHGCSKIIEMYLIAILKHRQDTVSHLKSS
ncbi:MAG: hypothetical protein JEZ08_17735 [Clostridiales bacterium]|nr:hypothetical protein [Clostridiales bacterium]